MLPSSANQETNTQIQPIKIYPTASQGLNPDNDGELEWMSGWNSFRLRLIAIVFVHFGLWMNSMKRFLRNGFVWNFQVWLRIEIWLILQQHLRVLYFLNFWRTLVLFVGLWYPFLDLRWCLLCFSKLEWVALFVLGGDVHVTCSLRFTSNATPADLLVASMSVEPFSSTSLQASIGGAEDRDLLTYIYKFSNNYWALNWLLSF